MPRITATTFNIAPRFSFRKGFQIQSGSQYLDGFASGVRGRRSRTGIGRAPTNLSAACSSFLSKATFLRGRALSKYRKRFCTKVLGWEVGNCSNECSVSICIGFQIAEREAGLISPGLWSNLGICNLFTVLRPRSWSFSLPC